MHLSFALEQTVSSFTSYHHHYFSLIIHQPPSLKVVNQCSLYLCQILSSTFSIFPSPSSSSAAPTASIDSSTYELALLQFFRHILSVPLLPNRIPLTELPRLVSRIPWADLPLVASSPLNEHGTPRMTLNDLISSVERSSRPHTLANLLAFLPPRYTKLPRIALASYLEIYTVLLDGLNIEPLEAPQATNARPSVIKQATMDGDSSDTENDTAMDVDVPGHHQQIDSIGKGEHFRNGLDSRTISRLSTLFNPTHLSSLLSATSRNPTSREQFFRHVFPDICLKRDPC